MDQQMEFKSLEREIQNHEMEGYVHNEISESSSQHRPEQIFQIIKIKNKKKWTREEDLLLIKLAEQHREKHWKDISKHFVNKNALQCFSRYKRIRPGIVKGAWSREEDEKIMKLVQIYGKAWSKISKVLVTRNGKQIRDRFINVLDPEIKKGKFTEEEDNSLISLYMHYGPKWATIAKHFLNRTADMIKNRFHSSIKKLFYSNNIKRNFPQKKLEITIPEQKIQVPSRHKNSLSSNFSTENVTNITNNMSFSFLDSKNHSPTNASSQEIQKSGPPQRPQPFTYDEKVLSDYPKFDYPDFQNYKDYMKSIDPQDNPVYDDNFHFNEDLSYNNNSNLFNFDEYFTVN